MILCKTWRRIPIATPPHPRRIPRQRRQAGRARRHTGKGNDHPLDTHGERNVKGIKRKELEQPYGIPYSCLLPAEYDNLIAASRGASFSHIAASSCRLSRTMMALGEAAGEASALALRAGAAYAGVDVDEIRGRLGIPAFEEKALSVWGLQN